MESGKPEKARYSAAAKRLYRENKNIDRQNRGLQPLPAKKKSKSKSKPQHTHSAESDLGVTRSAISDLTKVITYLNNHYHAHAGFTQCVHHGSKGNAHGHVVDAKAQEQGMHAMHKKQKHDERVHQENIKREAKNQALHLKRERIKVENDNWHRMSAEEQEIKKQKDRDDPVMAARRKQRDDKRAAREGQRRVEMEIQHEEDSRTMDADGRGEESPTSYQDKEVADPYVEPGVFKPGNFPMLQKMRGVPSEYAVA